MFLSCSDQSSVIKRITFASYGNPSECPNPTIGSCSSPDSRQVIESHCLNQTNCSVST